MRLYCFLLDVSNVIFTFILFDLMKTIKIFQTCVYQAKRPNAEWLQNLMIRLIKDIQIIVFNTNNFYASSPTHFYLYTISVNCLCNRCFPRGSAVKNTAANAGDVGSALGWERSPGEGTGNPLQYSCLGSPMERGALQASPQGCKASIQHNLATKLQQ